MSPSDRPAHFPLLPFRPLTPGNTGPLLLLFRVAAEEEEGGRFRRRFAGLRREGPLGGTGAFQLIPFPAARFLYRSSSKAMRQSSGDKLRRGRARAAFPERERQLQSTRARAPKWHVVVADGRFVSAFDGAMKVVCPSVCLSVWPVMSRGNRSSMTAWSVLILYTGMTSSISTIFIRLLISFFLTGFDMHMWTMWKKLPLIWLLTYIFTGWPTKKQQIKHLPLQ